MKTRNLKQKSMTLTHRETGDKMTETAVKFLSSASIHEASFDEKVTIAKIFGPVDHLFHDVEIECV